MPPCQILDIKFMSIKLLARSDLEGWGTQLLKVNGLPSSTGTSREVCKKSLPNRTNHFAFCRIYLDSGDLRCACTCNLLSASKSFKQFPIRPNNFAAGISAGPTTAHFKLGLSPYHHASLTTNTYCHSRCTFTGNLAGNARLSGTNPASNSTATGRSRLAEYRSTRRAIIIRSFAAATHPVTITTQHHANKDYYQLGGNRLGGGAGGLAHG